MANAAWRELENLIIVAGHAIYVASNFNHPEADSSWFLQDFQKGEARFYIEHIDRGVDLAATEPTSLLVFSGGQTRVEAGARSEATGYWLLAEHVLQWKGTNVRERATTEEYARDSFENLLFSICRFYECTQRYPRRVTVVSWRFKRERFELHRKAIRLSENHFAFEGVNDPAPDRLEGSLRGERIAVVQFTEDPYGVRLAPPDAPPAERTKYLGEKRKDRNPFNRLHPYSSSCPGLAALLEHRTTTYFNGWLPW